MGLGFNVKKMESMFFSVDVSLLLTVISVVARRSFSRTGDKDLPITYLRLGHQHLHDISMESTKSDGHDLEKHDFGSLATKIF